MKKSFFTSLIILGLGISSLALARPTTLPPTLTSPCNDQTVSSLTPQLKWGIVSGAWSYAWEIQPLGGGPSPNQSLNWHYTPSSATPPTSVIVFPDILKPDKSYQWYARSIDNSGNSSEASEGCQFNTNGISPVVAAPGEPTITGVVPASGWAGANISITGENYRCAQFNDPKDNIVIFTGDNNQEIPDNFPVCDGLFTLKSFVPFFPDSVKTFTIKVKIRDKTSNPFAFSLTAPPAGSSAGKDKLELSWPKSPFGTELNKDTDITGLIKYLYEWGISLGGLAAFIVLVYAGFRYLTSAGDPGKMKEAMDWIKSAGLGLVLLLASVLILNTVNPQLTQLKNPSLGNPEGQTLNFGDVGGASGTSGSCSQVRIFSSPNYANEIPGSPFKNGAKGNFSSAPVTVKSIKMTDENACLLILYQGTNQQITDTKPPSVFPTDYSEVNSDVNFYSYQVTNIGD